MGILGADLEEHRSYRCVNRMESGSHAVNYLCLNRTQSQCINLACIPLYTYFYPVQIGYFLKWTFAIR